MLIGAASRMKQCRVLVRTAPNQTDEFGFDYSLIVMIELHWIDCMHAFGHSAVRASNILFHQ